MASRGTVDSEGDGFHGRVGVADRHVRPRRRPDLHNPGPLQIHLSAPQTLRRNVPGEFDTVIPAELGTGAAAETRAPRADVELMCTLRRHIGSPIGATTLTVGPRGMQIRSPRPLTADETVGFDLPNLDMRVNGRARVLREERPHVYALRFENLPEPMMRRLHALAINAR